MPRINKGHRSIRAELEGAVLELIVAETDLPDAALRIEQAIKRTGLSDLLGPALKAVTRAGAVVYAAKVKVSDVASGLGEG